MKQIFLTLSFLTSLGAFAEPDIDLSLPELGDRVSGAVSNDQERMIANEF